MRRVAIALILAGLCATPVQTFASAPNVAAARALGGELSSVNLDGVGFADSIDYLRDLTGANINVNWRLMQEKNINKDTPVHMKLRAVSMRKALQLLLDEVGAGTPLTYFIDQGVIEITTQEAADAKLVTRVYDVGDLMVDIPDFAGPSLNITDNSSSGSNSGKSGGGGGNNLFGGNNANNNNNDKPATANDRGNELVSIITTTIRPEVWQINGGPANIRFFRNRLIVTAPRSVQEMIGGRAE